MFDSKPREEERFLLNFFTGVLFDTLLPVTEEQKYVTNKYLCYTTDVAPR